MFVKEKFLMQLLPDNLESLFNDWGWETIFRYRLHFDSGPGKKAKDYARVHLFRSTGSDGVIRHFGMIHTHGREPLPGFGQEEIISHTSPLGALKRAFDETGGTLIDKFFLPVYPITLPYVKVFNESGVPVDPAGYYIENEEDRKRGIISIIGGTEAYKVTYGIDPDAPDVPRKTWFFLLDEVIVKKVDKATKSEFTDVEFNPKQDPQYDVDMTAIKSFDPDNGYEVFEAVINSFLLDDPDYAESMYFIRLLNPSFPSTATYIDKYEAGWGRDTEITVWGNITKNRIALNLRVDPAPGPEKAYFVPLYIGKLITMGKWPQLNSILITGTTEKDEIRVLSPSSGLTADKLSVRPSAPAPKVIQEQIGVIDHGGWASNGNDSVMLHRTIGGANYQRHVFQFITFDDKAAPDPEHKYNPSAYTDRYHVSAMAISHCNDGTIGVLDEVYAVHPKGIGQSEELEIVEDVHNEMVSIGDGETYIFHLRHAPIEGTLRLRLGAMPGETECTEILDGEYAIYTEEGLKPDGSPNPDKDKELKMIKIIRKEKTPKLGQVLYADYKFEQTYVFNLPTTPITPFRLPDVTPYNPIGWALLKSNTKLTP
ncbi:hypothetical protein DFP93_101247 [Aneurinibacillus soli]|uniref:Uncharacterized protein n=1 Tax=Aneurinibacillus soli TaxID=1500254 RepID=A0A0U5AWS0_9BACL|nr:hypothetical protein [Aneurinibacillus soli]PYE64221.1 hypothetical protein DFP93_101247 [Aneurinibacillus soli]BAU28170.1 hypothetical protein CB4_02344 [Aneurinibacillus soli]